MFGIKIPLEGYADIHAHIIPGVDDGAKDRSTAFAMLRIAYEDGIRMIVATPHYHPDKVTLDDEEIYQRFLAFQEEACKELPGISLYYGREIYGNHDAAEKLLKKEGKLTLCNTSYVLVEFSVTSDYQYMINLLKKIMMSGYIPVIAHAERYECLMFREDRIRELRSMNMVIQVNAMSITGKCGKNVQRYMKCLLRHGLVDVVATDAHSAQNRCPRMKEAAAYVARKCGNEMVEKLFIRNPQLIIEGKYLEEQ